MFILGGLVAAVILIRQVRWIAVIALLITVGYFVHNYLDDELHLEHHDKVTIMRPGAQNR